MKQDYSVTHQGSTGIPPPDIADHVVQHAEDLLVNISQVEIDPAQYTALKTDTGQLGPYSVSATCVGASAVITAKINGHVLCEAIVCVNTVNERELPENAGKIESFEITEIVDPLVRCYEHFDYSLTHSIGEWENLKDAVGKIGRDAKIFCDLPDAVGLFVEFPGLTPDSVKPCTIVAVSFDHDTQVLKFRTVHEYDPTHHCPLKKAVVTYSEIKYKP